MISETVESLYLPYPGRKDRHVRVWVPAHAQGETFPVVYMTDGQNLFDVESSTFGCWYTREAVRDERAVSGRAAIIVGVHNEDPWRANELMPETIGPIQCPDEARPMLHPSGEVFDEFLVHTVMPAVEARFPVRTGRANTAFCGSSMGGLMAFFTALSHPDVYCAAAPFSPCFNLYTKDDLMRWIRSRLGAQKPYLYLFAGGADELEKEIQRCELAIYDELKTCYPERLLKQVVMPEQRHHETAWEPRFLEFLHTFLTCGPEF